MDYDDYRPALGFKRKANPAMDVFDMAPFAK